MSGAYHILKGSCDTGHVDGSAGCISERCINHHLQGVGRCNIHQRYMKESFDILILNEPRHAGHVDGSAGCISERCINHYL